MRSSSRRRSARQFPLTSEDFRFCALLLLLALCAIGGGGARGDIQSLLYLRPMALLITAALLVSPGRLDLGELRTPLRLLALLAIWMAVQLIPLPPALWAVLPGHAQFVDIAGSANFPQPWRPLSLTPDLTLNSLVSLLVPAGCLIALCGITAERRQQLLYALLGVGCVGALLGFIQFAGMAEFYLYDVTNHGLPVGLYANRNHQAAMLALLLPMLGMWVRIPMQQRRHEQLKLGAAVAFGVFVLFVLLATGSRAGVGLGAVGLVAAIVLGGGDRALKDRRTALIVCGIALGTVVVVLVALLLGGASALDRLADTGREEPEMRAAALPTIMHIIRDFFPFGSGFGSFDRIFRIYEPDGLLDGSYRNHAHNDLAELVLTGGLPAILLLGALCVWVIRATIRAWFEPAPSGSMSRHFNRLGSVIILLLFAASLADYPLRTPMMGAIFTIALAWLSMPPRRRSSRPGYASNDASESDYAIAD